ncbi:hypothetical protein ID866_4901 [Astraeus odoratus]|nr:hypothetical protein ID866_4901 [Astraeus odoratus]
MDTSSVLSDEDYDVISNPSQRSLDSSILADDFAPVPGLSSAAARDATAPSPTDAARSTLSTVSLSPADIQAYVRSSLEGARAGPGSGSGARYSGHKPGAAEGAGRTVRVYVDGVFDGLDAGHLLQLRQAKLSFASVHLLVGVFPDATCHARSKHPHPHVERCEALRHVRWVDEVVPDAPWVLDDAFVLARRIDYVALEEGSSVDPEFDKERLRGYDALKRLGEQAHSFLPPTPSLTMALPSPACAAITGRVIPTRRTHGLAPRPTMCRTLAVPPCTGATRSAEGTPSRPAAELEPEHTPAEDDVREGPVPDVTHGIHRLTLEGQW